MSEEEQFKNNRFDNARIDYHVATNLWIAEAQMLWSKINALLLANSIILYINASMKVPSKLLLILGLVLCILGFYC